MWYNKVQKEQLLETKLLLNNNKIHRDWSQGVLGLSQEAYFTKVLKGFQMKNCSPIVGSIMKGGM